METNTLKVDSASALGQSNQVCDRVAHDGSLAITHKEYEEAKKSFIQLPTNSKKTEKLKALQEWNNAATAYFNKHIDCFLDNVNPTIYNPSHAVEWLMHLTDHYASVIEAARLLGLDPGHFAPLLPRFKEFQEFVFTNEKEAVSEMFNRLVRARLPAYFRPGNQDDVPKRIWIPGVCFTGLLLVTFVALLFRNAEMMDFQLDLANRLFAVFAGLTSTFMGGTGLFRLQWPKKKETRVLFSATAGLATFAFVWVFAPHWFNAATTGAPVPGTKRSVENRSKPENHDAPSKSGASGLSSETKFLQEAERLYLSASNAESRGDAIRLLRDGVVQLEPQVQSDSTRGMRFVVADFYTSLEDLYRGGLNYEQALKANAKAFLHIKGIYDVDPLWEPRDIGKIRAPVAHKNPKEASDPSAAIALFVWDNRARHVALEHARRKGRFGPAERKEQDDVLKTGTEALRKAKLTDKDSVLRWGEVCLMYWINNNLPEAQSALDAALNEAGTAGPYAKETPWRRHFFGNSYLMKAALLAEQKKCNKAVEWISKAKEYLRTTPESGMLGYGYLLVARACPSAPEAKVALNEAHDCLKRGDYCFSCRYNLACVLARKAQLTTGEEQEKLLAEGSGHLLEVITFLTDSALEPALDVLERDPFLKPLTNKKDVKEAIARFKWEPKEDLGTARAEALWHFGIPLQAICFTRLNGDLR